MLIFYTLFIMQIVLEPFPISSSGHLQLVQSLYALPPLPEALEFLAHIPTVVIISLFFSSFLYPLIAHPLRHVPMLCMLALADSITVVAYVLRPILQTYMPTGLVLGFFVTAVLMLSLYPPFFKRFKLPTYPSSTINIYQACALGGAQACALMIPGMSRFGTTFVVARWLGIESNQAFITSWALALPLMSAAGAKALMLLPTSTLPFSFVFSSIVIGATIVSYYAVKFFAWVVHNHFVWITGIYLLIPLTIALYKGY